MNALTRDLVNLVNTAEENQTAKEQTSGTQFREKLHLMWTLSNTDRKYTLTVKNEILYSLPSAGGTGIYLYMIGGMLLMFAAVWILYKNKCKEVLEK